MTTDGIILVLLVLRIGCFYSCKGIGADKVLTFDGMIVNTDNSNVILTLICTAQNMPFQCNTEFLHNNSTVESLRNGGEGCYDKFGKCEPGICSCSEDCKSFRWNFTTSTVQTNDSLGCSIRIYNSTSESYYKVYVLVVYNGTDFTSVTSVKWPILQTAKIPSQEKNTFGHLLAVLITVLGIGLVVLFVCLRNIHNRKQNGKKHNSKALINEPI